MGLDEAVISEVLLKAFSKDFSKDLDLDVAVVGAGPSGLTAARYLAEKGVKVAVFERNLYIGGGIWGGGMLFPRIVIQEGAKAIAEEAKLKLEPVGNGLYVADAVEAAVKFASAAIDAGARIWIGIYVEDVIIRNGRVAGVVINWMAAERARLHVDPLSVKAKVVIDATGHDAEVVKLISGRVPGVKLPTSTGEVIGLQPMWAEIGEKQVVENTMEVYPGLIVAGIAANVVAGSPRMGPVFGGMLLSGKKAAELALKKMGR